MEILQARILEWVAIPSSRASSQPRDRTQVSHIAWQILYCLSHQGSPRILECVNLSLLQGNSPDPRIKPVSPALQVDSLPAELPGKPILYSVQFSCSVISDSLRPHGLQHARLPCPSPAPGACSNSCPSNQWCHATISSSVISFSSCLQFCPASGSFLISQFFTPGGQSMGASASVLPVNIQDWFPLRLTGLISLLSKGLSRVFSNTTVQKHQFFGAQLSS